MGWDKISKKLSRKPSLTEEEEDRLVEEIIRRYNLMTVVDEENGKIGLVRWNDDTNSFEEVSQEKLMELVGKVLAEHYTKEA